MLHSIKAREEGRHRPVPQAPIITPRQTPIRPATQPSVYSRYDQERFNRLKEGKKKSNILDDLSICQLSSVSGESIFLIAHILKILDRKQNLKIHWC